MFSFRIALLSFICCVPNFAGSVLTRDGKTIQGQITAAGTAIIVTPSGGQAMTIELSNVRRALFEDAPPATAAALDSAWNHADLGKVHVAGGAVEKDGVFAVRGSGWGAWGPKDSGHFVHWVMEGDGQIIAHVAPAVEGELGAMAGVMIRSSLDPDSNFAAAMIYPTGEVRFGRRPIEGYVPAPEHRLVGPAYEWVRLARSGNNFSVSRSKEGRFWQPMGKALLIEMPAKAHVGLFVAAGTNTHAASAAFDHVQRISGTPGQTYFAGAVGPESGVVLVDGSMLAGYPRALQEGTIQLVPHFSRAGQKLELSMSDEQRVAAAKSQVILPQNSVARLRFTFEPPDLAQWSPGGSPGVLLIAGDFMEAEIERVSYSHYIDVNSVVFGTKRLEAPRDVICAVLHEVKPTTAAYEVRLRDGSILQAKSVRFDAGMIEVDSPLAGVLKFPVGELVSVEGK